MMMAAESDKLKKKQILVLLVISNLSDTANESCEVGKDALYIFIFLWHF